MRIDKLKKTRKDGTVRVSYMADAGKDPKTGKKRRKTFATRGEAKAWLDDGGHKAAEVVPCGVTLAQIGRNYADNRKAAGRERSTYEKYEQHFTSHINVLTFAWIEGVDLPEDEVLDGIAFGSMRPAQLRARHFLKLKETLVAQRSHAMTLRIWSTLTAALDLAVTKEHVDANLAASIKIDRRPRETLEPVDIPPKEHIAKIAAAARPADGEPIFIGQAMIALTLTTGLRPSEMRALAWDRIEIDTAPYVVSVKERVDQWAQVGKPKSASGYRDVPVPESTAKLMREWRLRCPKIEGCHLVFPTGAGTPWNLSNIHNRIWNPLQVNIGLSRPRLGPDGAPVTDEKGNAVLEGLYTWYALRHAYASMQIELGLQPKQLQKRMGHASVQTTMDIYGHLWKDHDRDAADMAALDRFLRSLQNQ